MFKRKSTKRLKTKPIIYKTLTYT